jgi:hypothetical protein
VQQNRDCYFPRIWLNLVIFAVVTCSAVPSFAQKTVVQDAGGGRKIELDYDLAGRVTERRILGADGKVMNKTNYEYRPGYYQQQEIVTSYWPDGKVKTLTRTSYDPNANFTLEFVQIYDESGKQIGGHRLTHDPESNVYNCKQWNVPAQDYKEIKCPAGGEGGGEGPEEAKKFTYDEVVRHVEAARNAALLEQKQRRRRPAVPEQLHPSTLNKEIGLVLPTQIGSGSRFSGSVIEDPQRYEDMPGIAVFRITLPFTSSGTGSSLLDWEVVSGSEKPQPADGPVTFTLPPGSSKLSVTFRQSGNVGVSTSKVIDLVQAKSRPKIPHFFQAATICLKGQLCVVSGPFSGDSTKTFASFDERPALIVTETPQTSYIEIPERIHAGAPSLFIAEGAKLIALPVVVAELALDPERRDVSKGQTLLVNARLDGPEEVPETEWQVGNFPSTNLEEARKLVPGFQLPKQSRETDEKRETGKNETEDKREKEERKSGEILLVLKNATPDLVTLRTSKNGVYIFRLKNQSFSRGGFSYDLVAEAINFGTLAVKGYVIPFLAPVAGQEFALQPTASEKLSVFQK